MTHDIRQTATLRDFQKYIFSHNGDRQLRQSKWMDYFGDDSYGISERWIPPILGGPSLRQSVRSNATMEVAQWVDALWPSPPEQYNALFAVAFSAPGSMTDSQAKVALGEFTGWQLVARSAWSTTALACTMWKKIASPSEPDSVVFTHPASGTRELGLVLIEVKGLAPDRLYSLNDLQKTGGHSGASMEPNLPVYHPPDSQEDYIFDIVGLTNSGAGPAGGLFPTHSLKPIEFINGTNINGGAFWGAWSYPPVYGEAPWIDDYTTVESRAVAESVDVMPRRFSVDQDGWTRLQKLGVLDYVDFLYRWPSGTNPPPPNVEGQMRLFIRDNGSGKTQVCARFHVGTIIVLGTET